MSTVYRLTVVTVEDNPDFDAKRAAEWQERQSRGSNYYPSEAYTVTPTKDTRVLDVVLSAEEYEAIKQAVIRSWA